MPSVPQMFDRLALRYDLANSVLSFGRDRVWRNRVVRAVAKTEPLRILDVACGTGALTFALSDGIPSAELFAVDPSNDMRQVAERRAKREGRYIEFAEAFEEDLPYEDASFDVVTNAFGIRNAKDRLRALQEAKRVLKPEGTLHILEFGLPAGVVARTILLIGLWVFVPVVGAILTWNFSAYIYLARTIHSFLSAKAFEHLVLEAGFSSVSTSYMFLGLVRHVTASV